MAKVLPRLSKSLPGVAPAAAWRSGCGKMSRVLLEAYGATAKAIREERAITPAAEWLIDNFYVAQEQIRQIREDLPRGFYRGLPKLADGPFKGYPRVFGVAWAFVAHTDSRFEPEMLSPVCPGLSAGSASDDRRAVGGRDNAAHRAGGEFTARRRERIVDERAARESCGRAGRPAVRSWRSSGRSAGGRAPRLCIRNRCQGLSRFSWSSACAIKIRR